MPKASTPIHSNNPPPLISSHKHSITTVNSTRLDSTRHRPQQKQHQQHQKHTHTHTHSHTPQQVHQVARRGPELRPIARAAFLSLRRCPHPPACPARALTPSFHGSSSSTPSAQSESSNFPSCISPIPLRRLRGACRHLALFSVAFSCPSDAARMMLQRVAVFATS